MRAVWKTNRLCLAILVVACLPAYSAMALEPDGDPGQGDSWSQAFYEDAGPYDHIQMLMVSGAPFQTPTAIGNFNQPGWSQTYNDGTLVLADGSSQNIVYFTLYFSGPSTETFTFYFQCWSGNTLKNSATVTWGPGWGGANIVNHGASVPGGWDWGLSRFSVIEVSQPTQMTSDSHYERGNSVLKASDNNYWLFWARHKTFEGNYGSGNPDDSNYDIYYSRSSTLAGLAGAGSAVTSIGSIFQGQTSCVEYDDKIWVFGSDSDDSAQIKAWTTPVSGPFNWSVTEVLPEDPFNGTHLWATVFDSKIFLAVNRGDAIDLTTYTTAAGWTAVTEIVDHEGMPRLYDDSGTLYFYYCSWGLPAYYVYEYSAGPTWTIEATITGTADDDCDPMLTKVGDTYVFIFAPWNGTKQFLKYWTAATVAGFDLLDQTTAKIMTFGEYTSSTPWVDMWPATLTASDDVYMFYGSEADGTARGTGNIYMLEIDWDLASDHYCYIQNAIDQAVDDDVINVADGDYMEQLEINKPLTLTGAGSGATTTVQSPDTLTKYFGTNYPIIYVHDTSGVTIQDVKVDGLGKGNANYRFEGIAFWNAGGNVIDCVVTGVRETPLSGAQHGVGVYAYNDTGGPYTVNVTDTDIDDYQKNAFALSGTGLTANVTGCTVTGSGPLGLGLPAQNGIQIGFGAGGTIDDCTVSDHLYTGGSWASSAVLFYQGTSVAVTDTVTTDNIPGLYCQDTDATVDGLTVSNQDGDSGDGMYAYNTSSALGPGQGQPSLPAAPFEEDAGGRPGRSDMSVTVTNSRFIGHDAADSWGVSGLGYGNTLTMSVTYCDVTDWDYGIVSKEDVGTVNLTANDNTIHSNVTYGFWTNAVSVQDAEDNWWGSEDGPEDTDSGTNEVTLATCDSFSVAQMYNAVAENTGTLGDPVSDNVDYCPWLEEAATLTLNPDYQRVQCFGDTVTVTVDMTNAMTTIVGADLYLEYDKDTLDFESIEPGDDPFIFQVYEVVDEDAGTIDYGVGVDPFGGTGTSEDTTMAVITFTALADVCAATADLVQFQADPVTRLSDDFGHPIYLALVDLSAIIIDGTPPVLENPDNVTIECDLSTDPDHWIHKMHFPQLPDPFGWDVRATYPRVVADDWTCSESGDVLDIHFWGSWQDLNGNQHTDPEEVGQILGFWVSIHLNEPGPPSHPAERVWFEFVPYDKVGVVPMDPFDPPALQGWYNPWEPECIPEDHDAYFRYDIDFVVGDLPPFPQEAGTTYWLDISAVVVEYPEKLWGWKTTQSHYLDAAVWSIYEYGDPPDPPTWGWEELHNCVEPYESLDMAFVITGGDPPPLVGHGYAHDNCDDTPDLDYDDVFAPNTPPCDYTGTITRTWTATDYCDNVTTCVQTITVQDTTDPVITCPADVTVECDSVPAVATATATDNCDPAPVVTYDGEVRTDGYCEDYYTLARTWTATDDCGNSASCTQTITVQDTTAPVLSGCPTDMTINADAGGCTAVVTWTDPTATDNCDPAPVVVCNPLSGSIFQQGPTLVTCTATDDCDNIDTCTFTVTVSDYNELEVDIDLSGTVATPLTRCITFELWECAGPSSVTVEQNITFTNGSATDVTVLVPCGNYTCITARDTLHTLQRAVALGTSGTKYVADFTTANTEDLIGGNLNDDSCIDILDFGVFVWQWAAHYDSDGDNVDDGDTPCGTPYPHADISGQGQVNTEDFTFIQVNYRECSEVCCPGPIGDGPITRISVAELKEMGLSELAVGDLNNDGWLDEGDIEAFILGARPKTPVEEPDGGANAPGSVRPRP